MSGRHATGAHLDWVCLPSLPAVVRIGVIVVVTVVVAVLVSFGLGGVIVATAAIVEVVYRSLATGQHTRTGLAGGGHGWPEKLGYGHG